MPPVKILKHENSYEGQRSSMKIKCHRKPHQNLVTSRGRFATTHIPNKLQQFLIITFLRLLCRHTRTDGQDRKQYSASLARRVIILATSF